MVATLVFRTLISLQNILLDSVFQVTRFLALCGPSDYWGPLRNNQNFFLTSPYNSGVKSVGLKSRELGFTHINVEMGLLRESSKAPHVRGARGGEREGRQENLDRIIIWSFTYKYLLYSCCMLGIKC